jgi:putative hydrolase of the HAD superfamily
LVIFDVDYTLLRPGTRFEAEGYRALGREFGLELDPGRWGAAERAVGAAMMERRERLGTRHDEAVYEIVATTIIEELGGGDPAAVAAAAHAQLAAWWNVEHFTLYDDVLPCLQRLEEAGLSLALLSNTSRDLDAVAGHFGLGALVDFKLASSVVGYCKPAPEIFAALLAQAGVPANEAVMVGDNLEDDVRGAIAAGCHGVLLDRRGRSDVPLPTIRSLDALPALLGLPG